MLSTCPVHAQACEGEGGRQTGVWRGREQRNGKNKAVCMLLCRFYFLLRPPFSTLAFQAGMRQVGGGKWTEETLGPLCFAN